MSTSDLNALRDDVITYLAGGGLINAADILSDYETAVDAKARADERERIAEAIAAIPLTVMSSEHGKAPGTAVVRNPWAVLQEAKRVARNGGGEDT